MAKKPRKFCWHHGDLERLRQCLDNGYCDLWPSPKSFTWWKRHKLNKGDRVQFSVKGKVVACGTIKSDEPYDLFDVKGIDPVDPEKWPGAVDIGDIRWRDKGNCSSTPRFGSHWL
jgi:hypothetical protein